MGRYWIRNRGRVQGPFTEDRIQGLLRRGRFSRSFHVSQDNKNWYPASEFPELFAGVGRFGSADESDDGPFQTGISPFDDDDLPPARVRSSGGRSAAQRRAAPVQEEDADDDDEAWEDDDGSNDEDWEDDPGSGAVGRVLDWVEANVKAIVVLLVIAVGVASWLVFGRESFARDAADLETLIEVKTRINAAFTMGAQANEWLKLADDTEAALAPLVDRLADQASSRDHVKQELLFAARDDIPQAFKELPNGIRLADQRLDARFARIEDMIRQKTRQHPDSVLSLPPQAPATSAVPPAASSAAATAAESSPATSEASVPQGSGAPAGAPASAVPASSAAPGNPSANPGLDRNSEPASGMPPTTSGATPSGTPAAVPPPAQPAAPANSIPGRPQPAKF